MAFKRRVKVLILSVDRFEDSELRIPCERLSAEGAEVNIASPRTGRITGKHGYQAEVDKTLRQVVANEYDLLVPVEKLPKRFGRPPTRSKSCGVFLNIKSRLRRFAMDRRY